MGNDNVPRDGMYAWNDDYSEIDLVDILSSLWKRRKLIAAVTAACLVCAAGYLALSPRVYESRTTLLFLPPLPPEIENEGSRSVVLTPDTYFTLATADDLLNDVIAAAYAGAASDDVPSVEAMRRGLKVKLAESSEKAQGVPDQMAMTVSFRAKEPERAMAVLNNWSSLFIQRNAQLFVDRTGSSFEFLGKSVETVKRDLEATENRLLVYQKENAIPLMKVRLAALEKTYSGLLAQYDEKAAALPPLEAEEKAAARLLAKEPETETLSRGMSREALWNLAAQPAGTSKEPGAFNVSDEIQNSLHKELKERRSNAEIKIASLRASLKDLSARIEKAQRDYAALNSRILAAETEVDRLQREKATLQESYAALSKQYQRSRIATVEATDPIKIVEKPILTREPVARGGLKILCLAGLLGLFLGTTAALVAEMFAKRAEAKA
ncbi:Wzz/FepE/Etk N-terminal domain-containing protein [Cloacibacillus sp. An23]|uniref:GumC family protein n=1 Tax=Cloacibacillus sp. An23 TaxID=1965591 RepID=UPI000B38E317|nr:Wzz/FepE/Etk N-terminal domain-containing protein [Cloacibacillus sp. An23]OUO94427.1 hypothetical protein B5F39_04175 [Cloacibacillus sp. An23]